MKELFKNIKEEEFKDRISIRFKGILEGFNKYPNKLLEVSKEFRGTLEEKEELFLNFFKEALKLNKNEVIVDFYIKDLEDDSKERLLLSLNREDREILNNLLEENNIDSVYFEIKDNEAMDFITRLNTRELFFSTVYFFYKPITIWGNYSMKFPIFFEEENILREYECLLEKYSLILS